MSKVPALGKLVKVDPKSVWSHEAHSFTPWLAQPENLALLGEVIGIELELEAVEQSVGPFRADILCKQVGTGHWVLIENQLEKTDHGHLGQILTYAAGLEAVIVIWLSPQFTDEHRACLDWLNRFTLKGLNFFGVQIEVWRIGESMSAPRFNVVSQPNDWAVSVAEASASLGKPETLQTHLQYWGTFREALIAHGGHIKPVKPLAQNWLSFSPFGRTGFSLSAATNKELNRLKVELYLNGKDAQGFFRALRKHQAKIEAELGSLTWNEKAAKDRNVIQYLESANPTEKEDWARQHKWLVERLYAFLKVLGPIVKELQPIGEEEV